MLSPLPVECHKRAADLDLDVGATSASALPDVFGSQLAGSTLKTSLSYNHHHHHQSHHQNHHQTQHQNYYHQNHHPHGDLMPAHAMPPLTPSGGPCAGQGQQKGGSLYPRALSAIEPRDRLDHWVAATGKGLGHGQGHKSVAQARTVGAAHCGVPSVVGRCASARHRLARESDVEAHMRAEPCVTSSLPCAGLEQCSPAAPPPLTSMPLTPARQAEGHTQAQAQGHLQAQAFSIPVGVPTRRQQGPVPFTQSLSPPTANPRRSSGDAPSPSREGTGMGMGTGTHCQSRRAAGVPCEMALQTLLAHSFSVRSNPENYYAGCAAAPGMPPVCDPGAAAPETAGVHAANSGVGVARAPGGYTRQGEAQARGKDLPGMADSGYQYLSYSSNSAYGRSGLAPGRRTSGVPGAHKQSHMGVPSVGSLQRAMLPPVAASEGGGGSPLPMAGRGAQECDLRTQSARLGGLRVRDFDPQAHRGASPLERYNSLQDEGGAVHRGQGFQDGRPHLSPPPPPSASTTTPQQGSVFHWAAKARIHAKTELSRRSSV